MFYDLTHYKYKLQGPQNSEIFVIIFQHVEFIFPFARSLTIALLKTLTSKHTRTPILYYKQTEHDSKEFWGY